ncbi:hypothetical protein [Actinacidiphila oryziradicis]|jgi:hypothetical protein|uniref:Uncharacterized protein n=1 Tax=Actinacidiphila oryziradicis TaxID=2571141 RepID=A0A4U0SG46_9ACTN|nr:hypothetical protein [Actinacidiphila oryziradicis]MCW2872555.1 hypothetical protein [Actinacidiphila oryziradicis]TKA08412.1 hypothetical protein FCI23_28415 [Actinacidiphila oryziradicis]
MIRTAQHASTVRTGPADLDLPFALALTHYEPTSPEAGTTRAPEVPAAPHARRRHTARRRRTAAAQG